MGFNTDEIGLLLTIQGVVVIVFQLGFFPPLTRRMGAVRVFQWGTLLSAVFFIVFPAAAYIMDFHDSYLTWLTLILVMTFKGVPDVMAFISVIMLVSNSSPPQHLGATNGIGQSGASLMRTVGPVAVGAMWTVSTRWTFNLHQFTVFVIMAVVSLITFLLSLQFKTEHNLPWEDRHQQLQEQSAMATEQAHNSGASDVALSVEADSNNSSPR